MHWMNRSLLAMGISGLFAGGLEGQNPQLTVTGAGNGNGTVTAAAVSCTITAGVTSGDCTEQYTSGIVVTLTAAPATGHTFNGWTGDCSGTSTTCQVTMNQARAVTAGFTVNPQLTVTGAGNGNGTVTAAAVSCTLTAGVTSGDCTEQYTSGTVVTLTAAATTGHTFAGWSGHCTGASSTCQVTMNQARGVTARFEAVSATTIVTCILTGAGLTPQQEAELDNLGNQNGSFDVGDFLAFLDRAGLSLTTSQRAAAIRAVSRRTAETDPRGVKP